MNSTFRRLLPAVSVFAAAPALACGGPVASSALMGVILASMVAAPLLAALIVDRGTFTLAGHMRGLTRKHRPTVFGPILAAVSLIVTFIGVQSDVDLALTGFALVPVAAAICGMSFIRSVIIEQRGQPEAQALRVAGVIVFSLVGVAPTVFCLVAVVPFLMH